MRRHSLVLLFVVCAVGCRPCLQPVTEKNFDSGVESALDAGVVDTGVVDAGVDAAVVDAGVLDAGVVDAGVLDAGVVDAGVVDAGVVDAGVVDAGVVDAGVVDAGVVGLDAGVDAGPIACPGPTLATAAELARPRRMTEWVELAVIEGTGDFMASEADYLRAERESALFWEFRDAGIGVGFLPDYSPMLSIGFDTVGAAELQAGTYNAWDCLNQAYGGSVSSAGGLSEWRYISFRPLNMITLAREYARLPHVRYAQPAGIGITALCGSANDLCVEPSASGSWTWLAVVEGPDCRDTFYRVTTEPDGGRTIEQWDAGQPPPNLWFEQAPQCAMNLRGNPWRYPDGGLVMWSRDGGS